MALRVVLDTNVIVSALNFRGNERRLDFEMRKNYTIFYGYYFA